ncbi:hypothetical protein Hanom_Chr12g01066591 [Helianthus anomalus]
MKVQKSFIKRQTCEHKRTQINECSRTRSRTPYRTFTNTIELTRPLFMFIQLTNRTKFLVRIRSFIKQTDINELPADRFTNCSLNVRFVYSPRCVYWAGMTWDQGVYSYQNIDN